MYHLTQSIARLVLKTAFHLNAIMVIIRKQKYCNLIGIIIMAHFTVACFEFHLCNKFCDSQEHKQSPTLLWWYHREPLSSLLTVWHPRLYNLAESTDGIFQQNSIGPIDYLTNHKYTAIRDRYDDSRLLRMLRYTWGTCADASRSESWGIRGRTHGNIWSTRHLSSSPCTTDMSTVPCTHGFLPSVLRQPSLPSQFSWLDPAFSSGLPALPVNSTQHYYLKCA